MFPKNEPPVRHDPPDGGEGFSLLRLFILVGAIGFIIVVIAKM